MKKITLLILLFFSILTNAQTETDIIQSYLNQNAKKSKLNSKELSEWKIYRQTYSDNTKIKNCIVKQTLNGIEVDQTDSYFWIKDAKIINTPKNFVKGLAAKTNTANPSIDIVEGLKIASQKLDGKPINASVEKTEENKIKLIQQGKSIGSAKLLYFKVDEKNYRLAWKYEFYSDSGNHLWEATVDAVDGKLLNAIDLTVNCKFHKSDTPKVENTKVTFNVFESLFKKNSTMSFMTPGTTNYKVVPFNYESPIHYKTKFPTATDGRTIVTNPEVTTSIKGSIPAASPKGWHDSNELSKNIKNNKFNYTSGNNVHAYEDYNGDNSIGASPTGTGTHPDLTFNFSYGGDGSAPTSYIDAAITNLFYMNNVMHDLWYQYGFDEANGNFQTQNYGRSSSGDGDHVLAEAQDASQASIPSLNNANFSTPADGSSPRMQMYLWNNPKPPLLNVNTGSLAGTQYYAKDNAFSQGHVNLPVFPQSLTQNLVLFNDGTPDNSDACTAAINSNELNGKIAVIRRGNCAFIAKVKEAQNAGAVGVIIVNNAAGSISMSGSDSTITIPAISMTQIDGEALISSMSTGTVNVSIFQQDNYINGDSDFDNGIIAHEYGHGISTRLTGALRSSEQPGEGWSDFFWLVMQIKPGDTRFDARGIGTYVNNESPDGSGIRQYRYSTDMTVNPHTFASTNSMYYTDGNSNPRVDVHSVGSVWCAMLWDLTWDYIDKYGYDSNIYSGNGGNNKIMQLVIDALKLTPRNPSLIECRDAIIAADQATTGGQDFCMIWKAFARRGLGVNASSGTNPVLTYNSTTGYNYAEVANGIKDQIEDFTVPAPGPNCTSLATTSVANANNISIYPNPSNGTIYINMNSVSDQVDLTVIDLNGRTVYQKEGFISSGSIDLNQLQSGIYILNIKGENINHSQKIILN